MGNLKLTYSFLLLMPVLLLKLYGTRSKWALVRRHKYILENLDLHYIHKGSLPYSASTGEEIDVNILPAHKEMYKTRFGTSSLLDFRCVRKYSRPSVIQMSVVWIEILKAKSSLHTRVHTLKRTWNSGARRFWKCVQGSWKNSNHARKSNIGLIWMKEAPDFSFWEMKLPQC